VIGAVAEVRFTEAELSRIADLVADRVMARLGAGNGSPWLSAEQAADYIRAPLSRIRKLTSTGDLPCHHDGRKVLYRRDELDAYVRDGGAVSP
jgi:excisionase family DNA binding protein